MVSEIRQIKLGKTYPNQNGEVFNAFLNNRRETA